MTGLIAQMVLGGFGETHNRRDDPAERPDKDNPEWTVADMKKARPALDVVSEVFGEHASAELRRGGTPT